MNTLTERDLRRWEAKLSGASHRKAGGVLCGIAAVLFAIVLFMSSSHGEAPPKAVALSTVILGIGVVLLISGLARAGFSSNWFLFML